MSVQDWPPLCRGVERGAILSAPETQKGLSGLLVRARPALALIIGCLLLALAFSLVMGEQALALTREGGVIETLTVFLYAGVLVVALFARMRGEVAAGLIALAALLMGLRELDAHKAFTTYGLFKTRLYVSPDVPLVEKLLAGLVVLALLVLLVLAIRSAWHSKSIRRSAAAITLFAVGGFGIFLKEMDGLPRQLRKMGMLLQDDMMAISKAVEETGELGLPLLLALALWQLRSVNWQ